MIFYGCMETAVIGGDHARKFACGELVIFDRPEDAAEFLRDSPGSFYPLEIRQPWTREIALRVRAGEDYQAVLNDIKAPVKEKEKPEKKKESSKLSKQKINAQGKR